MSNESKKNAGAKATAPRNEETIAVQMPEKATELSVMGLFQTDAQFKQSLPGLGKAIVKSMSPMLKPDKFPVGSVLTGRVTKLFPTTPAKDKVGTGVEIIPDGLTVGIALPVCATLRTGLEVTGDGNDAKTPWMDTVVSIRKMAEKIPSKKGNDAHNFVVAIFPDSKGKRPEVKNSA